MTTTKKLKTKTINMTDLPQLIDALFIGDPDRPGWVIMEVNTKGRDYVDALFPNARIAWRDSDLVPADWHGFSMNVPDVVRATETKLPLEITRGANLDEANPDALAFLLAAGVNHQGGRSAVYYSNVVWSFTALPLTTFDSTNRRRRKHWDAEAMWAAIDEYKKTTTTNQSQRRRD